ncbi:Putative serine protease K12H4.7 [Termitomyces sp. J132]|nr:Putative serine protease K12H4.7 [Termitomyces sp. J132]
MFRLPGVPRVPLDNPSAPVVSRSGIVLPPYNTVYYFDQLIDHNNPSMGTFKQRYWHTYEFYEPVGGPIILMTPGESNADGYYGYLTNRTINGLIAQQQNASTVVLEHRFYGLSNPKPDLSVESLRLHTIQQAVDDLVYFTKTVKLPMPRGDQVTPDKSPWILIGGSYSGALTSWTMVSRPGIFWAGYGSSGVVEAILDFWEYFEPIRLHMPANCSADVQAVIAHVDETFTCKNATAIQALKETFGLGNMAHLDDVAGALRNNLWDWQSLQPSTGPGGLFYQFCDALEVKDGVNAPATGWGLDHALAAWGFYFKNTYYAHLCNDLDPETCLGTYDPNQPYWTDISVDNALRSWSWIVCNEVGYFQEGAPKGHPSLVTRLVQPSYDLRQCQLMFPEAFPEPPKTAINKTNEVYKGWDVKLDRLFFANGRRDPWKDATISAARLQHIVQTTPNQPIYLSDGFHCSDLKTLDGQANSTIYDVQVAALKYFKTWLAQWKPSNTPHTPSNVKVGPAVAEKVATVYNGVYKPINAFFKSVG